jgi:hypothetical protein
MFASSRGVTDAEQIHIASIEELLETYTKANLSFESHNWH